MLVGLYTVRAVLNVLGTEDYGIYNVVAGIVVMFGFLNSSMAGASQRYFSFEIGRGDFEQLKKIFSLTLGIYILIAIIVLILAETIGLWFVSNRLVITPERMNAAGWVYQFSIISFLITIVTTPYTALIIAHEDMSVYAYGAIIDVFLKLMVVFFLRIISVDRLQLYGTLTAIVTVVSTAIYRIFCKTKYQECKFRFYFDLILFKEYLSYTGWNLFGAVSDVIKGQGINILLNQFFNAGVIAARSISFSINGAVTSLMFNFNIAIYPRIIKLYSLGQKDEMISLIFYSAKISYFLMYIFILPLMLEMPAILLFWLKTPPEYTVIFTRLVLMEILVRSISAGFSSAITATGKLKMRTIAISSIYFLNLPVSWFIVWATHRPDLVAMIAVFLTVISLVAELYVASRLVFFPIRQCLGKVIVPVCIVTIVSLVLPVILYTFLEKSFLRLCVVTIVSIASTCSCIYVFGLNMVERSMIKNIVVNKVRNLLYN
jgi:O-antigen/teichoic acid export membrane protein